MSSDSLLGKQLDEYLIERPLGRGGMASVYLARDVKLQRYVALKVIASDFRSSQEYRDRFEREAQSVARFNHPNIVQIFRFGEVYGVYYMAMQYVEGADLGSLLHDYKHAGELMPIADVVRVIDDIGAALDYAHNRGVIHRDVKSSNIILNKEGQALLTDFGLVLLSDVGTHGEVFGSPEYIAPEQAVSSKNVVPQSDLYALGVTLFEMLTGEVPFMGKDSMEVAMRHLTDPPPSPSDFNSAIPPSINAIVLKMLEKEPSQRYQTGAEFSRMFREAVNAWTQGFSPRELSAKRPSLMSIPEKVREYVQNESLPTLPPPPPISLTPAAPLQPPPALSADITHLHQPKPKSDYPWGRILLIGGLVFVVGLIAVLLALNVLLNRNNTVTPSTVAMTPATEVVASAATFETPIQVAAATATNPPQGQPTAFSTLASNVVPVQPAVNSTPTNIPITVLYTATPATVSYTLLIKSNGEDSLFVANQSAQPFPLASLRVHDSNGAITGADWGIEQLPSNACVAAWKDSGNVQQPDIDCELMGERITRDGPNRFWKSSFDVFYNNALVGTCNSGTCTITITP